MPYADISTYLSTYIWWELEGKGYIKKYIKCIYFCLLMKRVQTFSLILVSIFSYL